MLTLTQTNLVWGKATELSASAQKAITLAAQLNQGHAINTPLILGGIGLFLLVLVVVTFISTRSAAVRSAIVGLALMCVLGIGGSVIMMNSMIAEDNNKTVRLALQRQSISAAQELAVAMLGKGEHPEGSVWPMSDWRAVYVNPEQVIIVDLFQDRFLALRAEEVKEATLQLRPPYNWKDEIVADPTQGEIRFDTAEASLQAMEKSHQGLDVVQILTKIPGATSINLVFGSPTLFSISATVLKDGINIALKPDGIRQNREQMEKMMNNPAMPLITPPSIRQ